MCGILGLTRFGDASVDLGSFQVALDRLRHRGPDDEGFLLYDIRTRAVETAGGNDTCASLQLPPFGSFGSRGWSTVLGHRRLSILDLSAAGHQPMCSADGRYWISYNGEIYNYLELRNELRDSQSFKTRSDTEVLLAAYAKWGASMLERLIGMFAFCILDVQKRELFLARDPFGVKPMYFVRSRREFAFASEIKGLEALGLVSKAANMDLLYEYLRHGERSAGMQTMFANVHSLPGGHWLSLKLADGTTGGAVPYVKITPQEGLGYSFEEATAAVRDAVEDSVRLHLRSDVPVGSCLSGGLDSTAIATLARRHLDPGVAFNAFSFIADDPVLSEEAFVDMVPGVIGHKTRPVAEDLLRDMNRLIGAHDLPFGSSSVYAQFRVFDLAKSYGMKVMLDGQGADEIFAGYLSLTGARIASLIGQWELIKAGRLIGALPSNARTLMRRVTMSAIGRKLPRSVLPFARVLVGEGSMPAWLNRKWFEKRGLRRALPKYGSGRNTLKSEMVLAIEENSLPQLLRYEDINSMFFSIESRVPFCDLRLARLALSLPEEYLISQDGKTKNVFREAMRGIVPEAILKREKIGFQTPERPWLATLRPWLATLASSETFRRLPFLTTSVAKAVLLGERGSASAWNPYIWRIINIALWAERHDIDFDRFDDAVPLGQNIVAEVSH